MKKVFSRIKPLHGGDYIECQTCGDKIHCVDFPDSILMDEANECRCIGCLDKLAEKDGFEIVIERNG